MDRNNGKFGYIFKRFELFLEWLDAYWKLMALAAAAAVLLAGSNWWTWQYGQREGFRGAYEKTFSQFQKHKIMGQVDFSDVDLDIDTRQVVKQLRYLPEEERAAEAVFAGVLYSVHSELIEAYTEKMDLEETHSQMMTAAYDSIHDKIAPHYFQLYQNKQELWFNADPITERKAYNAANDFGMTLSESVCHLLDMVSVLATMSNAGLSGTTFYLSGICPDLLNTLMPQLALDLREAGALVDMDQLHIDLDDYLRRSIAEIATVEDVFSNLQTTRKIKRELLWGMVNSTATVRINGEARVKAGIDLDEGFEYQVDAETGIMEVRVLAPKILSREIHTTIAEMENGYFVGVNRNLINSAERDLEIELEREIQGHKILVNAQENFEQFFEAILMPVMRFKGVKDVEFQYLTKEELFAGKTVGVKH